MRRTGPIKIRYTLTRKTTGRKVNRQRSCGISQASARRIQNEINSARHDLINAQVVAEKASKEVAAKAPEVTKAAQQAKPAPGADNNYSIFDFDDVITDGLSKMKAQADKMRNFKFDPNQFLTSLGESCDILIGGDDEGITLGSANDDENVNSEYNIDYELIRKEEGFRKEAYLPIDWHPTKIASEEYLKKVNEKRDPNNPKRLVTAEEIEESKKLQRENVSYGHSKEKWLETLPINEGEIIPDNLQYNGRKIIGARIPLGNSGVTIASGFDLGQQVNGLDGFGFSAEIKEKLDRFVGLKRYGPIRNLAKKPLEVTTEQAHRINYLVKEYKVKALSKSYNRATAKNKTNVKFEDLPSAAQTVLYSVNFQLGDLSIRAPRFWCFATHQLWGCLLKELRNFGGSTVKRRGNEADHFVKHMPSFDRNDDINCNQFYAANCEKKDQS